STWEFNQVAKQVHTSMARVIFPFHTTTDGDVLLMVTTSEVENRQLFSDTFGYFAAELARDAVMSCFE
ncbi:MAG: P1 family peptidase, partial [Candidatus Heimdallarchaeota archaeon]